VDNIETDASIILNAFLSIDWVGLSLEQKAEKFSRNMASLWKVHPFRERNTRTIINFYCDLANYRNFNINR
jgi:cell filamentation protein